MNTLLRTSILTIAGSVGIGLAPVGVASAASTPDQRDMFLSKRELSSVMLAVEDDNELDDDTTTRSNNSGTGNSNDRTNSRVTAVTRDRDRSRGDLTRDWTRDGGDRTKDHSRHHTNDSSRNDSRRSWR
jgi:hypothetical protein